MRLLSRQYELASPDPYTGFLDHCFLIHIVERVATAMETTMIGRVIAIVACLVSAPTLAAEWEIRVLDEGVDLSVTGDITYGERQRFYFRKGNCNLVQHLFSNYTVRPVNFDRLIGTIFAIEFNGSLIGAELFASMKAMLGDILIFKLGVYDKDVLLSYLIEFNKMSIRFVDGNNLKASDYFDAPYNEWSMAGISEAFESSYRACLTRLASSMVPPSS